MRSIVALLLVGWVQLAPAAVQRTEITFDWVREQAAARHAKGYQAPAGELPGRFGTLTYDEYRAIEFRRDRALWGADRLPFQVQFFTRGGLFHHPVALHEFSRTHVQAIPFSPDCFTTGALLKGEPLPSDLGYAGFKVLYPLNRAEAYDELVSFVGASYFRALGAGQQYGLSARGLALDGGVTGRKEEFPRFSEFWLGKPEPGASAMTIHALLESPSVTGAYEFIVTPGRSTFVDVRAALFFRSNTKVVGYAPLTSMFWYGENTARPEGELRPEVHDSDGLLVHYDDGIQLWRPLRNPSEIEMSEIPARQLKRFGLFQRDRQVSSYVDAEAHYERRPTAWIEPREGWAAGAVRLVELPATREYADNVVAYWVPATPPATNRPVELRYRVVWSRDEPVEEKLAKVMGTREGARPGQAKGRLFWIDFADEKFAERAAGGVKADVEVGSGGRLHHSAVSIYREINGWRAAIEVDAGSSAAVELRCRLRDNAGPISETWSYTWKP
jgi:glucans biosynthesis protein